MQWCTIAVVVRSTSACSCTCSRRRSHLTCARANEEMLACFETMAMRGNIAEEDVKSAFNSHDCQRGALPRSAIMSTVWKRKLVRWWIKHIVRPMFWDDIERRAHLILLSNDWFPMIGQTSLFLSKTTLQQGSARSIDVGKNTVSHCQLWTARTGKSSVGVGVTWTGRMVAVTNSER